jgi:hypothetical protein
MPEVRLLVPLTDNQGNPHAVGEVVDVDVETAEAWRAGGKVSLISAEQAAEEAAAHGHYSDVVSRTETQPLSDTDSDQSDELPGPQSSAPPPKKGKK